ncbi:methyltransferase domain-containing protein [Azospirillum argentinense]|uniref:Trans-aconitate 2-methyltransferase n=1 Tax=Azospirillum argentinense TaxID=2970906 RepID=A0A5B0L1V4_9PROT|nr:methyltransferase domain-containing protein [Azospirillum argentinense]KAA1058086.1 Trans-aconitate 2-methyltransferase [Azospirillum argentinense]
MPWDPEQYARFESWRRRPAHDLVAALPSLTPRTVVDLGCGAGQLARLLAERWPETEVLGVDNSPAMLERARTTPSGVRWLQADLRDWRPDQPVDLLISNAALQWLDGHERLFPDLLRALAPGGVLAVQMPRNFDAPSHRLLYETAADGPWAERLAPVLRTAPVHAPDVYYGWLAALTRRLDLWETEYLQVLEGEDPVLEWTRGTTLLPVLDMLAGAELDAFLAAYRARLNAAYPRRPDGRTLFPFKRLFLVARI